MDPHSFILPGIVVLVFGAPLAWYVRKRDSN